MRSISLYGLSDVILTFDESTDDYFARQVVFERLSEVTYPPASLRRSRRFVSPSGLVYRYVLESPDRTPQELKTIEDWVDRARVQAGARRGRRFRFRRHRHAVSGAARSSEALRLPRHRAAGHPAALGQQRQRRRWLLLAGRSVLLRSRPRPGSRHRRHWQRHRRLAERRAGPRARHGRRHHRQRAAARRIRLQQNRRRRRRRDHDARAASKRKTC